MFFRTAWLVLRKDVAIEAKSWEVLTTTLFFAVSCVLIFAFAFVKEGRPVEDAAAGILWIAIAFSGTLALGRTFERERYGDRRQRALRRRKVRLNECDRRGRRGLARGLWRARRDDEGSGRGGGSHPRQSVWFGN